MWAFLEKCHQLEGHFSCSLKAVCQLHERQEELGQEEHVQIGARPVSVKYVELHLYHGGPEIHFEGFPVLHAYPAQGKRDEHERLAQIKNLVICFNFVLFF